MPSSAALILYFAFIFFLLKLEAKQAPDVSWALWIPTIWMLSVATKPMADWFRVTNADPESGSSLDRTFLIILMLLALGILFKRKFSWASAVQDNGWIMALLIFMVISILWSSIPGISFKRWIREFQAVLMAFVVLSESSPRQAMESILRRTTYILIPLCPVLVKYFPQYGIQYGRWSGSRMWIGVATQKNGLGRLCMIAAFFLIWSLFRRWQGRNPTVWKYQTYLEMALLALTLWLITGGQKTSATSLLSLFLGLISFAILALGRRRPRAFTASALMLFVASVVLFGTVVIFSGQIKLGFIATAAGRDETLTGRTEIWSSLVPVVKQHPVLGGGFGGFWTPLTRKEFHISGSHNGYLDVLLGLGVIGVILVLLFLLSSCRKANRFLKIDYDWGILWIGFIIMTVVHNISESSIDTFTQQLSAILLFFAIASSPELESDRHPESLAAQGED